MRSILRNKLYAYPLIFLSVLFILAVGMVFYHAVEGLSWVDAYYFCIITLTTVGYGDITPKTDIGKIFTTFYLFVGIGMIGLFINTIMSRAQERQAKRREKHEEENTSLSNEN